MVAVAGTRERSVDAYRAFAILTVVIGHWLAFALSVQDGALVGRNLLEIWAVAPWLTWFFQVMPVFFIVGGYAGAASWGNRDPHTTAAAWIGLRLWRLLVPSLLLLASATAVAVVAGAVGVSGPTFDLALSVVGLPLWFLAVYVVVVACTPWLVAAEARWGLGVPLALAGLVVVADVLYNHAAVPLVGWSTFATFWLAAFASGVCWRQGSLPATPRIGAGLAVLGGAALALLVAFGPYPVSMLAAAGERVQNNGPPSVALMSLAIAQLGLVLLLRPVVDRWSHHPVIWKGVVAVNLTAMSIYLWHMVAGLGASALFWVAGLVEAAPTLSTSWWLLRPVWYGTCALLLWGIVRVVRRVEWRRPLLAERRAPGPVLAAGVLLCSAGMVQLTVTGLSSGPVGVPVGGLAAFVVGLLAVRSGAGISGSVPLLPRRATVSS